LFERLKNELATHTIETELGSFALTASFGIAEVDKEDSNIHPSLNHADKALYQAKKAGRNCVVLHPESA
jgi:diguanylate cyclase (GGDEF)-like protein